MALICSGVYLIQAESIYLRFRLNPGPWGKEYVQINTVWRWQSTLGGGKLERRWVVSSTGRKLSNSQHYIVTVVICYTVTVLWYEWFVLSSTVHCCVLLCGHCRINMCKSDFFSHEIRLKKNIALTNSRHPQKKRLMYKTSVSENTKDNITSTLLLSLTRERTLETWVKTNCSFAFCFV